MDTKGDKVMITIEKLNEYGADTKDGLARCLGMEEFYLKLVNTMLGDENFDKLDAAVEAGEVKKAFEAAHALKGTLGNLAITPILDPVVEMTERFRNAEEMVDVSDVYPQYKDALERFRALAE